MKDEDKIEATLRVYYNASLQKPEKIIYVADNTVSNETGLGYKDVSDIEVRLLDNNFLAYKDNTPKRIVKITTKGIKFIKNNGFEGVRQRRKNKLKELKYKKELDISAKESSVVQAKFAKKAYYLSWVAIAISIYAIYNSSNKEEKVEDKKPQVEQVNFESQRKNLIIKQK